MKTYNLNVLTHSQLATLATEYFLNNTTTILDLSFKLDRFNKSLTLLNFTLQDKGEIDRIVERMSHLCIQGMNSTESFVCLTEEEQSNSRKTFQNNIQTTIQEMSELAITLSEILYKVSPLN